MDRIPAGTFVACYLGELLRGPDGDKQGMENGDSYLFNLDKFFSEGDGDDEGWEPHADLLNGDGDGELPQASPSGACSFSPRKAGAMTARDSRSRRAAGDGAGLLSDDVGGKSSTPAKRERPGSDARKTETGSSEAEVVEKKRVSEDDGWLTVGPHAVTASRHGNPKSLFV